MAVEERGRGTGAAAGAARPGALSALLREIAGDGEPASEWERALRPGAVIGRFELVRELGRGGFGIVYEARDRELGRAVAFKAITRRPGSLPPEERLLAEAEAAARLSHPNIVTLHDVGRSEHGPYLVFELLRGATLAQRLAQGPLGAGEALRVAVEVTRGLAHAHAHGVVHRDLTPGNVFLCEDGQVKLLDLGMASAAGRRKLDGGTPSYMAPEQWRGAPEDERTDVFALGLILHAMLAGELPFHGAGASRAQGAAPPALDVAGAPSLGLLVARMLSRDPVERPRDAGEVLAALTAIQSEVARAPPGAAALAVRRRRRRPGWLAPALVAAGLLAGVAAAMVARRAHAPPAVREPPSIAVLPFADLSPQRDQEYFSEGLAEEILNALAHVDGLRVTGRTSAFAFKGTSADLRTIGDKLRVAAVLEGSVRKAGSRVRVTAQLVDVGTGYHLWSETFERELGDIFAVQDEIARAVVAAMRLRLMAGRAPTREHRTVHPEAYTQYLLGRQLYASHAEGGYPRAEAAFERALQLDPGYAPAWAALSIVRDYLADHEPTVEAAAARRRRALAAAERSVALDPELAEGYSALAFLRGTIQWDWAQARADMDRAVALSPGDATIQRRRGILLAMLGREDEALAATLEATELDPLFPGNWVNLAERRIEAGDYERARVALERALEIAPGHVGARWMLAGVALLQGRAADALAAFEVISEEQVRLLGVAVAQHTLGHADASRAAAQALEAKYGERKPCTIAFVHAWRGEKDLAFAWLERAYAQRDVELVNIGSGPMRRLLGDDARYAALRRRMNLPPP